jgi:hypothetical protein
MAAANIAKAISCKVKEQTLGACRRGRDTSICLVAAE